jgi:hypothetical protein
MGEIDDARQVEDERQPERHQRIERADDEPVEDVETAAAASCGDHEVVATRGGQETVRRMFGRAGL